MTTEIWYALYKVFTLPIILTILLCWRVTSCVMVATATLIAGISSSSTKMMKLLCFLSKRVYICDLSLVQSKNFIKDSHPVKAANCIRKATWPFQIKQSSTKSSSKASKSKPRRVINESRSVEYTDDDVLLGRGGFTNTHPGNIRFREKALELRQLYESSDKEQKFEISKLLLGSVTDKGNRFLERGDDGLWHEVVGFGARKKASQALRERIKGSRR